MPPKTKIETKTCRMKVRTLEGTHEECGVKYTGESCPQPDPHLNALKTGFCANNWCEGTKAKTWRGDPAPTCEYWETCPCMCHDLISKMFDMAGKERIPVNESSYVVHQEFWMPTEDDRAQWAAEKAALSNASSTIPAVVIESPAPGIVPPTVARSYKPTTSGRTARGELESWINVTCSEWLLSQAPWDCTPLFISERIARTQGVKPPSTGAITAALDKWSKMGYAEIGRKPVRFVKFSEEGARLGLEAIKDKVRRNRLSIRSQTERGIRR